MGSPIQRQPLSGRSAVLAMVGLIVVGQWTSRLDAAAPSPNAASQQKLAAELVEQGGSRRGLCVYFGENLDTALDIAGSSELLVHVRDPRRMAVEQLKKKAATAGLGIDRLSVEWGGVETLPYADNLVDLIVADGGQPAPDPVEVLRALRPQGVALTSQPGAESARKLQEAAQAAGASDIRVWKSDGRTWVRFVKPAPSGLDEWTHWEHGPDNNPVSTDALIKAPYMTQFMAEPYYIGMPAITTAAGGRTFLAIGHIAHHQREWNTLNKLIARNGYNGTVLWERELPEGYLVHRSAFIATKEAFYMLEGDHCLIFDPQTGDESGEIRIPGVKGEWKWMVMQDGVLFILSGKQDPRVETTKGDRSFGGWSWSDLSRGYYGVDENSSQTNTSYLKQNIPWGYGHTLAAYDLQNKQVLWTHRAEHQIDSRAMALGNQKVYLYCPGHYLQCLESKTGKLLWTNDDKKVLTLIEERAKGLTSTPGFKTACLTLFTPDALIIQGQSRMNVVAVSTQDGYFLWTKKKVTNNPNGIYLDGKVILGVGPGGNHVAIDPVSGEVQEQLNFRKVACTRLTASTDSLFCRGEGMMRFDRGSKQPLVDGSVRPACNDGALPANGLLYLGPWQCDCNLSLIGNVARCSAGDFRFDVIAKTEDRLQLGDSAAGSFADFDISKDDWPTFRADNDRSSSSTVRVAVPSVQKWHFVPKHKNTPTPPVPAGGLTIVSGDDGTVRAIDSKTGKLRWQYTTPGIIKSSPTIAMGRVYFGSGDGYVYALEATTGRMLWRFRAAPVERHIMVYGNLSSTWPVHSGVLVHDGIAYFAAGIIDYDGTYVFALDAETGEIQWQNNTSGHLNGDIRKGVSAQGNLTIQGDRLLLAGGNQISPAPFDLETGKCLARSLNQGRPQSNGGQFVGVFAERLPIAGGRILYSAPENVSTKGSFVALTTPDLDSIPDLTAEQKKNLLERFKNVDGIRSATVQQVARTPKVGAAVARLIFARLASPTLSFGGVPPAWDHDAFTLVSFKHGKLVCCDAAKVVERMTKGYGAVPAGRAVRRANLAQSLEADGSVRWQTDLGEPNKFEVVSIAVCPNAIVSVVHFQQRFRSQPQWYVVAFNRDGGAPRWRHELSTKPLPGGLLIDRDGQVVVSMLDGSLLCLGANN